MTVRFQRNGHRIIELFVPFKVGRKQVRVITLKPMTYGLAQRWYAGDFRSPQAMLKELVVEGEEVMNEVRYPDVERVELAFIDSLPPAIREQIASGTIPGLVMDALKEEPRSSEEAASSEPELPLEWPEGQEEQEASDEPAGPQIPRGPEDLPVPPPEPPWSRTPPPATNGDPMGLGFDVNG